MNIYKQKLSMDITLFYILLKLRSIGILAGMPYI